MTSIDPDSRRQRSGPASEGQWRRGSELSRSLAAAAARVDELVLNAQSIAEQIYHDAEREAERHLTERRREADLLLSEQRGVIRDVFETLRRDLDSAERRAADAIDAGLRRIASSGLDQPAAQQAPEPVPAPKVVVAYPGAGDPVEARRSQSRARALIRAGQLAAAGHSRAQIETALRDELGVEEPGGVVDEILPG